MSESAVTSVTNFAVPIRRQRRQESKSASAPACTLEAKLDTSPAAAARILRALHDGCGTFVLTAVDGHMSARVQLTVVNTAAAQSEYKLGSARVTVDWSRSTVSHGARRVSLSRTELRLLAALLGGEGEPIPRSTLISRVWPQDKAVPDADRENALGVYMCSLRKRLHTIGAVGALQTVRGVGYRAAL